MVVYQALYGAGDIWVRSTNMFLADIEKDVIYTEDTVTFDTEAIEWNEF